MRLDLATDLRARAHRCARQRRAPDKCVCRGQVRTAGGKRTAHIRPKRNVRAQTSGCVTTGYDYTTPIQGAGGSLPYLIYDDTFSAFDAVPAASSLIGDLVSGYYAMIDNPPTSPGPGDDYWSVTPPDSRRYRARIPISIAYAETEFSKTIGTQGQTLLMLLLCQMLLQPVLLLRQEKLV